MKIAFYRSQGRIFDRLVRWWTRGDYSHCELVFSDGMCASASSRDGGVRFKRIDVSKWHVVEVPGDEAAARSWFCRHDGAKYDYLGVLGFLWRPQRGAGRRWFCSEACAAALGMPDPWRYCPNTLAAIYQDVNQERST